MLELGMVVLILWPGTELHECQGRLVARAEGLTALKDVVCSGGEQFYEVVGVEERRLAEVKY